MNLEKFYFPVAESHIALADASLPEIAGYKAIVSPQNGENKVISVVKNSYKLIPNRELSIAGMTAGQQVWIDGIYHHSDQRMTYLIDGLQLPYNHFQITQKPDNHEP